ncbi:Membrane-bound inhibitor of C-type lysozyme [Deinococcus reticulitermitis]|uniref:Membrane-bound inhibitor of C-type lysozyme n=1 Tax=Deinococcus reticulitermitis TaxID=856736 RepID=A0A1H6VJW6_9DEIO|nr:MliC family protein [Deinococcus reticulitermitis]SEJ04949.1 Membrane-bound inhibitor of C-type lysozyme [Deinococcus reticulitermitis]
MPPKILFALSFALLGAALAGGAGQPRAQAAQQTYLYACQGGQQVQVKYLRTGDSDGLSFAVLRYRGQRYGLAPAVSASGARYIGHAGLSTASGLEWWEHQGEGTLSTFSGDDASNPRPLLTCRLR